jgi:uncharacterized protein (DUF885 family)
MEQSAGERLPLASSDLGRLFSDLLGEQFRQTPELATLFGFDVAEHADLRGKLADVSMDGRDAARAAIEDQIRLLDAFPKEGLVKSDRMSLDVVSYGRRAAAEMMRFRFGSSMMGLHYSPYVVSQVDGAYQLMSTVLGEVQPVQDRRDADCYLARLSAFGERIDDETERIRQDAALSVVPPDFILDLALAKMKRALTPAEQSTVVRALAKRVEARGLSENYVSEAKKIYDGMVLPALHRQFEVLERQRVDATHDAGCWRFRDGQGFYETALRVATTTKLNPAEIHAFGVEQAKLTSSRLDNLLKQQGMTKGSIGERIASLSRDPAQIFPNTDQGREQVIAYGNACLTAIRERLPEAFRRLPPSDFRVCRMAIQVEAGGPPAAAGAPAADGSRPGMVYLNLQDTAKVPKYSIPAMIHHEALPGHQLEGGLSLTNPGVPLIRRVMLLSGFGEGWAVYAEQLADELGVYEGDPFGQIGYLQFQLLRANRCVVDTGIHAMGWSRERAVQYLIEQDGDPAGLAASEVDRYCVMIGQACSYKLGQAVFVQLRDKARTALGDRFDIKEFHDAVLSSGHLPLDILRVSGEEWISSLS